MSISKFRFQGAPVTTNTRTITNQVGPDYGSTTTRLLPVFNDANTIYVALTGSDVAAGTSAAPKRTINSACYAAYVSVRSYVVVKDSGEYVEVVDALGRQLFAAAGKSPTIKMPTSVNNAFDGITQTGVATYVTTIPAIADANYYSLAEYNLTGTVPGVFFTGGIQDVIKFKDVYIILSTNGIWWSDTGFSGWNILTGTNGVSYYYYAISQGKLYTHSSVTGYIEEIIVDANNSDYVCRSPIWSTGLTGATAILIGNDDFLCIAQNSSGTLTVKSIVNWEVVTDSLFTTLGDFNNPKMQPFKFDGRSYMFATAYNSLTTVVSAALITPRYFDGSVDAIYADGLTLETASYTTYYSRIKSAVQVGNRIVILEGRDTSMFIYSIEVSGGAMVSFVKTTLPTFVDVGKVYRDVNNPSSTRVWIGGMVGEVYYSDNISYATPTTTLYALSFTASTATQNRAVAFLGDTDVGDLTMFHSYTSNGVTDKQSPFLITPKVVVRNCARINGFHIDGAGVANTGLMPRQSLTDAYAEVEYMNIYNCRRYGIFDRQYAGNSMWVNNSILHDNGIAGCWMGNRGASFSRFGYNVIYNNQYGLLSNSCVFEYGPLVFNSSIFNNSVSGIYFGKPGQQVSKIDPGASVVEKCILWNNGLDLYLSPMFSAASLLNFIKTSIIGSYNVPSTQIVESTVYNIDPLLLPNGDYKDLAGGYAYDSFAMTLSAGPFTYTRSRSIADSIDSTFDYRPVSIDTSWQASNFTTNTDSNGNYSESWDGLKRLINLKWDAVSFSTAKEVAKYIDMIRAEDAVLKFGETLTGTGDDWVDQFPAAITIEECDDGTEFITKTGHPVCAKNQWVGYYLKAKDTYSNKYLYFLITSHTAGSGTSPVKFTFEYPQVSYFFVGANSRLELAYLPVKIDKSAAFAVSKYGYVSTPDTGYSLTLREVDLDD